MKTLLTAFSSPRDVDTPGGRAEMRYSTDRAEAAALICALELAMHAQGSKEPQPMPEAAQEALHSKEEFNASIPKRHT